MTNAVLESKRIDDVILHIQNIDIFLIQFPLTFVCEFV